MLGRAERRRPAPAPPASPAACARLCAVALALALLAALASPAPAQVNPDPRRAAIWEAAAEDAEARVADPTTSTAALEALRERLVRLRAEAQAAEREATPNVEELNSRMEALGPPPGEGAEEAPEIAERRKELAAQLAAAQAPVLEAQEAYQRVNSLIEAIDGVVRARFSAELRSQGPSPLLPGTWAVAADELGGVAERYTDRMRRALESPAQRRSLRNRLPLNVLLVVAGVAITFVLRRWLTAWVEARLAVAASPRTVAWLVALRNVSRLIVPAVGAGLLFAALNPVNLAAQTANPALFDLPTFILVLIWAGWLGSSLFAPRLAAYRLVPLDDRDAERALRLTVIFGVVLALQVLLEELTAPLKLRPETLAAIFFPLILLGAAGLWRAAALVVKIEARIAENLAADSDQSLGKVRLRFLQLLGVMLRLAAVVAPLLAGLGYFAAGRELIFPPMLTLGLIGSGLVIFALLNALAASVLAAPQDRAHAADGGLAPVAAAALVVLGALPLLALIWGARPSDIGDLWTMLQDGVSFGGIRLSATVILKLIIVLGVGIAVTRLLQVLLRGSVLPRTRLDAGGRNAVLAGVGYVGFFVAGIAAISAAGLDLSNIAIVAGALSVGIGFGLQNIVSNFVSGIILLVERPIKEGDWIEVGAFSGHVRGISVRSTEIETFDRASVILPNSDLVSGTVLNRTHKGVSGRLQVPVSVPYDADPKRVEETLLAIAEEHPLVLEEPGPRVLFMNLGPDTMDFEIRCVLRDVNYSLSVRSDMNYEIVRRLAAADIRVQPYARDPRTPEPAPAVDAPKQG